MTRFTKIVKTYVEFEYLNRVKRVSNKEIGRWLRYKLIDMGTTFVKIGQFLSTRSDILDKDVIDELKLLQDKIDPIYIDGLPKEFNVDPLPIASASIGQVYKGKLNNNDIVIKIKRPNIVKEIDIDFNLLILSIKMLKYVSNDRKIREFEILFDEYYRILKEETDFIAESNNMLRFKKMFDDKKWLKIPDVYIEYCTEEMVVMEYVPCIKIDEINREKFNTNKICTRLTEMYIEQVITHGFVHIDPHPGNIGITYDNKLVLYDFGMMYNVDKKLRMQFEELLIHTYNKNIDKLCDLVIDMGLIIIEPTDIPYFKLFLISFIKYVETSDIEQFKLEYINKLNSYSTPFVISSKFILLLRGISILEGICKNLDKDFNFKNSIDPIIQSMIVVNIDTFETKIKEDIDMLMNIKTEDTMSRVKMDVIENTIKNLDNKKSNTNIIIMFVLYAVLHNFDMDLYALVVFAFYYRSLIN